MPSINDVMLVWGIFYPPPPLVMLFYASFNIVGLTVMRTQTPPPPLWHDVIYGWPLSLRLRKGHTTGKDTPPLGTYGLDF